MATREKYKHRVLQNLAASVFFLCAPALFADSPKEHFEQLVKRGGGFVADTSPDEGQFVLAVSAVSLNLKVKNSNQLLEMARLIAQRDIAGFFGKKINSRNETRQEVITVRVDEAQKSKVKKVLETFESVHRVDIDQVLMGAEVFDTRHHAGELYVGFLLSDKRLKVVVKLRDASTLTGVVAIGLATIDKNGKVEDARKRAIENAKRSAVEQAFGSIVQGSTQIQKLDPGTFKSKLYTSSFGSVKSYKVVEPQSGSNGVVYKVKIIATVSKKISLEKIVAAWQNNGASFWIDPGKNPNNPGQDLLEIFSEFFGELGFRLTDRKQEADYHIALVARPVERKNPFNGQPLTQMRMTVVIKDPKVEVQILRLKNDERKSTSLLADPIDRKLDCARKACKQMAPELKKRIGKMVMDQLQNGREVRVSFMGGKNLDGKGYHFIKDIIDWMPGVQNCNKSIQEADREVRYTLRYGGSLDLLQTTLSAELVKHFPDNHPRLEKMGTTEIVYHVRKNKDPEKIGKSTQELAKLGLAAVLRLDIFKDGKRIGHGSGFLIAPNIAVTNEHVIRGGNGGFVKHPGNKEQYDIEKILMVDKINDIALVRIENTGGVVLELGVAAEVAIGDRIYSVGNPHPKGDAEKLIGNLDGTFAEGIISGIRPVPNTGVQVFQYTAATDHGSSGGPIINNQGKVIAVVKWKLGANSAYAGAPVNYLKDLLKKNKLDK